jgi:hypothetical protein
MKLLMYFLRRHVPPSQFKTVGEADGDDLDILLPQWLYTPTSLYLYPWHLKEDKGERPPLRCEYDCFRSAHRDMIVNSGDIFSHSVRHARTGPAGVPRSPPAHKGLSSSPAPPPMRTTSSPRPPPSNLWSQSSRPRPQPSSAGSPSAAAPGRAATTATTPARAQGWRSCRSATATPATTRCWTWAWWSGWSGCWGRTATWCRSG